MCQGSKLKKKKIVKSAGSKMTMGEKTTRKISQELLSEQGEGRLVWSFEGLGASFPIMPAADMPDNDWSLLAFYAQVV